MKNKSLRDKAGLLPRQLEFVEVLDFQKLQTADGKPANLKAGQVVEYWAEVRDAHPDPKHPSGLSQKFKVTLKEQEDPKKDQEQKQQDIEQKKEAEKRKAAVEVMSSVLKKRKGDEKFGKMASKIEENQRKKESYNRMGGEY